MANEPEKELCGKLFVESKNPKIDYSGSCTIGGQEYWLNGWRKESAKGTKYLSLSFKAKEDKRAPVSKTVSAPCEDSTPF